MIFPNSKLISSLLNGFSAIVPVILPGGIWLVKKTASAKRGLLLAGVPFEAVL